MEQEKNNNGVVIVLGVIVVILLALVILLATGTIGSKSKKVDNNAADKTQADKVTTDDKTADNTTTNNTTNTTTNNNNTNVAQQVRYYQYYTESKDGSETYYSSREIVLNTDKTAKWHFGGNASGGDEYKGTYTEDSNKIVLTLEREMEDNAKCDDNESVFPCKTTLTLTKSNNTLVEKSADGISYTYKLVAKKQLKLFN